MRKDTQKGGKGTKPRQNWVNSEEEKDESQHSPGDKILREGNNP